MTLVRRPTRVGRTSCPSRADVCPPGAKTGGAGRGPDARGLWREAGAHGARPPLPAPACEGARGGGSRGRRCGALRIKGAALAKAVAGSGRGLPGLSSSPTAGRTRRAQSPGPSSPVPAGLYAQVRQRSGLPGGRSGGRSVMRALTGGSRDPLRPGLPGCPYTGADPTARPGACSCQWDRTHYPGGGAATCPPAGSLASGREGQSASFGQEGRGMSPSSIHPTAPNPAPPAIFCWG